MTTVATAQTADPAHSRRVGVAHGVLAYLWWGMIPIYFKAVKSVPALEVVSHRVVWALLFSALLMSWTGGWTLGMAALRRRRTAPMLLLSSALVAGNWLVFIWAVEHNRIVEASFGYFINPLINVLLGALFLRERLRRPQAVAVALAACGVAVLAVRLGVFPWLALTLAFSFGFYGLVRKTAHVESLAGLTFECALLVPLALGYLAWLGAHGRGAFLREGGRMTLLLVLAGPITAIPLLWFASAARRLRLTTVGFLQYIGPTLQLLLAVMVYREPFTPAYAAAFALIWAALAVFTVDAVRENRRVAVAEI